MLSVPFMILIVIGLRSINANAEQNTTIESDPEKNTTSWIKVMINNELEKDPNAYPDTTTKSVTKIIQMIRNASKSINEKRPKETSRSILDVDPNIDSDLNQGTESYKDSKSKDADPLDSNSTSVATTERSDSETDEHKPLENEDNYNETETTISRNADKQNSNTETSKNTKLSDLHLEPNTEKSQDNEKKHTENVNEPFGSEENHKTESTINRNADDQHSNTEASKISDPHLEPNTENFHVYEISHTENIYEPLGTDENHNKTDSTISRNADDKISSTDASKISDPHLEPNTENFHVYEISHTENMNEPLGSEENHNKTEYVISRDANDPNSTTETSKQSQIPDLYLELNTEESIIHRRSHSENVNESLVSKENHNETESKISEDANDHNSSTETTKESSLELHLEPITEKSQVDRERQTDKVYKPLDNEENLNNTETTISRDADNFYLNNEASNELKISIENDKTHKKEISKHDGNTQEIVDHDNKQSNESKATSDINSKELTVSNKDARDTDAVFTRRNLYYDNSEKFYGTNAKTTDQPTTTELDDNYDFVGREEFTHQNLNYDVVINKKSTTHQAKPNNKDESDFSFGLTRRNFHQGKKLYDYIIQDTVEPIETTIGSEDERTVLSRSGRPKVSSPLNYETRYDFIVHPVYGNIPMLFKSQGKSEDMIPDAPYNGIEYDHHHLFPRNKILYGNYGNPDALNIFQNNANTDLIPDRLGHGKEIVNPENNGIVIANKKNPLANHETPLAYHGISLPRSELIENYENSFTNEENTLGGRGNNYARHENSPTYYGNPHTSYRNPVKSYDPLTGYIHPLKNYENPFANHQHNYAKHENLPTNNGNPHSNYGNPDRSYNPLTIYKNPFENHESPITNHRNSYAKHENSPAYYGNPHLSYENPVENYDPLTSFINPLENYENSFTSHRNKNAKRENPSTDYGIPNSNYGNPVRSYESLASYKNPLENNEDPVANHENSYVKHETLSKNYVNSHFNYANPVRSYDLLASYKNPQENYENPLARHGNNNAKHQNPFTNYGISRSNYGNSLRSYDLLANYKNPLENYENPLESHGKKHAKREHTNPRNPHSSPLKSHHDTTTPIANHDNSIAKLQNLHTDNENPLFNYENPLARRRNSPKNGKTSARNGNKSANEKNVHLQTDYAPFYNNFRHHDAEADEEIDDYNYPRTVFIRHQTNRTIVKSHKAHVPLYKEAVLSVPFRTFFL